MKAVVEQALGEIQRAGGAGLRDSVSVGSISSASWGW